jgi:hypothetical protein
MLTWFNGGIRVLDTAKVNNDIHLRGRTVEPAAK